MNKEILELVKLTPDLRLALVEMAEDFQAAGETRYRNILQMNDEAFFAYLRDLESDAKEEDPPSNIVPQTTYWLLRGGETLIGSCRLRLRLTQPLEHESGHIDYHIRPAEREKGYATQLLELCLERAREKELKHVILICDADNQASRKAIEKNGGILIENTTSRKSGKPILRYRINLEDQKKPSK